MAATETHTDESAVSRNGTPRTRPWVPSQAQEAGGSVHAGPVQRRTRRLPSPLQRALRSRVAQLAATPHGVDAYLQLFNPLWSVDRARALLVDKHRETRDVTTLTFDPGGDWGPFEAGQYVQIGIELDGRLRKRHFSLSSSARRDDGLVTLTVKAHDDGFVSRFLHTHARPGLVVDFSAPEGGFVIPRTRPDQVLLVSGGSGITPTMSILRTLLDEGADTHITFLHYARTGADRIFGDELDALAARHDNLSVTTVLTAGDPDEGALEGHLCREHLDHVTPDWAETEAYVCGPAPLLEAAEELWAASDAIDRLHIERFELHVDVRGSGEGQVRLCNSDLAIDDDGRPLLVQAEDAGLSPDYGCRMGICKTCTTRKISGVTENLSSGAVSHEDDEDIQICVSVARGDVELSL